MDTVQILLLALVQGITEFLPISSSGHLVLTPLLFGFELQALAFDVALHLGTLGAVVLYFRRELGRMTRATLGSLLSRRLDEPDARLGWLLVLATLPVVMLGLPLKALLDVLRTDEQLIALVIASTSIGFGLLLWWADWRGGQRRDEHTLGWRGALLIGLMQALAIIPGTSRSGITITAALGLGLTRRAASRFSFLLAIPTILMAATLEILELLDAGEPVDWLALGLAAVWSCLFAYLTIVVFLRVIERTSMLPFVLYRIALGALILGLILL